MFVELIFVLSKISVIINNTYYVVYIYLPKCSKLNYRCNNIMYGDWTSDFMDKKNNKHIILLLLINIIKINYYKIIGTQSFLENVCSKWNIYIHILGQIFFLEERDKIIMFTECQDRLPLVVCDKNIIVCVYTPRPRVFRAFVPLLCAMCMI